MSTPLQQLRELRGKTGAGAVVGLGAAAIWIILLAIVGAIAISGDRSDNRVAAGGRPRTGTGAGALTPGETVPGDTTPDGQPVVGTDAAAPTDPGAATDPDTPAEEGAAHPRRLRAEGTRPASPTARSRSASTPRRPSAAFR